MNSQNSQSARPRSSLLILAKFILLFIKGVGIGIINIPIMLIKKPPYLINDELVRVVKFVTQDGPNAFWKQPTLRGALLSLGNLYLRIKRGDFLVSNEQGVRSKK